MRVAPEDEQLPVQEARAGDPEAWNALLRRYRLPLYAYVFELVHHEQASLDIVQETFINAARHIGSLQHDEKFGSWLFNIAHQKCIQHWRRSHPEEIPLDPQDECYPDEDRRWKDDFWLASQRVSTSRGRMNVPPNRQFMDLVAWGMAFAAIRAGDLTGEPYKYRRTDDGQFVLYSVGWNEQDENGTIALKKDREIAYRSGDWVWEYPVTATRPR